MAERGAQSSRRTGGGCEGDLEDGWHVQTPNAAIMTVSGPPPAQRARCAAACSHGGLLVCFNRA